ncbi:uncharacterized protein LOC123554304 [Mercenaria mercenaria]|uniref:uncharacterized protein LOC123554304 n=1 Tax=Mercenaria mercenaria TaxID=6596 RepID=UPI00234F48EC|nr:uncharacterized protein LOC123554304 [Mercenaria mercenaria]
MLRVRLETQIDITDEDQKAIGDKVQKSKHYTSRATPENDTRKKYSNNHAEMLQGRLNSREIKDMKKKSQYSEAHRSELGDGSATSSVVKGETVDLSMDAAGVLPRHGVQRVSLSTRTSRENMSDPGDADLTTRTNVCSEIDDLGRGTQPDGNYVPTTTQASSVRPPTSSSAAEVSVWLEVNTFMSRNLSWDKFKMVYRRLTWKTNSELHETVEPDMDNALIEAHSKSQEAVYKLMIHWRQATPDAAIIHVFQALEGCQQKLLSEKLQSVVEKTRAPVNIAFGQISDNGHNVVAAPPRGELPTSDTLQSVNIDTNGIAATGHCANNLRMMELKI